MRVIRRTAIATTHPDYPVISRIEAALLSRCGGLAKFKSEFPKLIRQAIDEVIDTPRTGRVHARELEKTEKTYIGTKIEILVRNYFRLPKGILDLTIDGFDVDVKNTLGNTWMIPPEATGKPCILVASDEERRVCSFGILVAHLHHLTFGRNQDLKRSVSAAGFAAIHWLLCDEPYPVSFWNTVGEHKTHLIMRGLSGNERIATLFREVMDQPINRDIVQSVAQQKDYMKRVRRNGGARDILAAEGIAILWGQNDRALIMALKLGAVENDEFISHRPRTAREADLLRRAGHID